jgi:acetylornithine/succinyldiaminopimelate/putrescine aminotransferase
MLAKKEIMSALGPGDHASTFGGNPVTCAAAVASVRVILNEGLVKSSKKMGKYLMERVEDLKEKHSIIREVRGKGLMVGVELDSHCQPIVDRARERGLLLNCAHENVLRLTPPLVIEKSEIDQIINILETIIQEEAHD